MIAGFVRGLSTRDSKPRWLSPWRAGGGVELHGVAGV